MSSADAELLISRAIEMLAKAHRVKYPLLADHGEAIHPTTGRPIHLFTVVSAAEANGPVYRMMTDQEGKPLEKARELEALFDRGAEAGKPAVVDRTVAPTAAPITIQPRENILTLKPGDAINETITVTIPKNARAPKADVYFLADTTASMGGILKAVQAGAANVLSALSGLGADLEFGAGNYKDFPRDPYAFQHQLSPTRVAADVTAAIQAWKASGGFDFPEGQLYALDRLAEPAGGTIGWRAGAKRIIVWFGDAPGHEPVCGAISGLAGAITESSVTAKLRGEEITVLAISTAKPGLDGDPRAGAADYAAACGAPGGSAGQGTRIATATGGKLVTGINPPNIANTIISRVSAAVSSIRNVRLVPSASIAPLVASISPAGGYGPLAGDREHRLRFDVSFGGSVPCQAEEQGFSGALEVEADGAVAAAKRVRSTVPPCPPKVFVYTVKFVCGTQPNRGCECPAVRPGHYATEINVHNYSGGEVTIRKRVAPVVLAGAPVGREPATGGARAEDKVVLGPHTATMEDCCRLTELLFGGRSAALTAGVLEITASAKVAVTAVYTSSSLEPGAVSIDVEEIPGRPA